MNAPNWIPLILAFAGFSFGPESAWPVHSRGLGALRLGTTLEEASRRTGLKFQLDGPAPEPDTFCAYFTARIRGETVRARIIRDRIDRLEVSSPAFPTRRGVSVGDTMDRIRAIYGKAVRPEPHHYDGEAVTVTLGPFREAIGETGVTLVVTRGVLTEIWVGFYEGIRESEGCQ